MLQLTIYNAEQHEQIPVVSGRLLVGSAPRETPGEKTPTDAAAADALRETPCAVVRDERLAPRQLLVEQVERDGATFARITNLGRILVLDGGRRILAGGVRELALPAQLWIGKSVLFITAADGPREIDAALVELPHLEDDPLEFTESMSRIGQAPSSNTLAFWFEALGRLQRGVAGTADFFREAAYALFDPCGLDAGIVLLRDGDGWKSVGSFVANPGLGIVFRDTILQRMTQRRRTVFHDARSLAPVDGDRTQSFVVASPIFDERGAVVGAIYGTRFDHPKNNRRGVRPLESQFVQAVADTVSAALIRQKRETEAARARARFEQFFSPRLARELERNPAMLEGAQREVTVLFCDLRGFSSLAETLSSRETYRLLGDVLDRFTARVLDHDGVVIDYYGDGLACFWNAPFDQPDHALLACRTALEMLDDLPTLSDEWFGVTARRLRMGIGIHTGSALVGNAGSSRRLKYGPRGNTVNVASRVENATKSIGVPLLITRATREKLGGALPVRRILRTTLPGLETEVELFQPLAVAPSNGTVELWGPYEQALALLERGERAAACRLLEQHPTLLEQDGPARHLSQLLR